MKKYKPVKKITNKVPKASPNDTVANVKDLINTKTKDFEAIDYIYCVETDGRLVGVLSIKELLLSGDNELIGDISKKAPLITAKKKTSLKEIAHLVLENGIKEVPVVDDKNIFQGVIPYDSTTSIIHKVLRTDIFQLTGIYHRHLEYDNIMEIPFFTAVRHRLPWLLLGLAGGLLAAQIVGFFEKTLEKNILLAAFIPLVVYIADAVGTQLEAFTIRDFALFRKLNFTYYFFKQFLVVLILALLLGITLSVAVFLIYGQSAIAIVLGSAIVAACVSALFSGLFVPYIFRWFNVDPANASGPVGTIIQDVLSVSIYFIIASILI